MPPAHRGASATAAPQNTPRPCRSSTAGATTCWARPSGGEQLRTDGGEDEARAALAAYVVDLSVQAGAGLDTPAAREWAARVDDDLAGVRSVLRRALEDDDAGLAARISAPLARYWWSRGLLAEMLDVAERTAVLPSAAGLSPEEQGRLRWAQATTRIAVGRVEEAGALLREVVTGARSRDDRPLLAQGLFSLALTLPHASEADVAVVREHLEESAAVSAGLGDDWSTALALIPLGDLALLGGDVPAALGGE